jgi:PAS domain S-box-containing protein
MSGPDGTERDPALRQALDAAMDGVAILEDGVYQYVNPSHAAVYGYDDPADLVGRSWEELYGDEERERIEREVLPTVQETGQWRGEAIGRRRDGSTFRQELSLAWTDGDRLVCTVRDVSERYRRRQTLERYESILTNIHDGVYTLDTDGYVTWVNDVAVEGFDIGYSREELIGAPVSMLLDDADLERGSALIEDLVENDPEGSRRCEIDLQTAGGESLPCDLHLALLTDDDGEVAGTLGVLREIGDQKRREQRLSVLNRVLRHNLRNDINVILMRLEELAEEYSIEDERLDEVRRKAHGVIELGEKARELQQRLDSLDARRGTVDLAGIVRRQSAALGEAYAGLTVSVGAPETCPVRTDETVRLAVENLLENAAEHGSAGESEPEDVTVEVTVELSGEVVTLRIADDGPGIPDAEVEALAGEETALEHGSGFGLWVAKWCVENNGGHLEIEGSGEGTVVTVRLPAAQARM